MSVSSPIQTGGAAVLGITAVKGGVHAIRGLPLTGARVAADLGEQIRVAAVGVAGIALAVAALVHGGKGLELSAGSELDDGSSM